MKHTLAAAFLLGATVLSLTAQAAQFTITPVRIFMAPRDRAVAVTVSNDSDEQVVMQADLYSWKQKADGSDDLELTEDLVLTPPILKLAPRSRQVVRLALLTPRPAGVQQTYRLIVREVPEARPAGQLQLQLALAFSLPVFITPPGARRELQCVVERSAADRAQARCGNSGTAYAQIRSLELIDEKGLRLAGRDTVGYVLPGITRSFELVRGDGRIPGGKVKLQAALDDGTLQAFDVTLPE
ncbi:MAG: molecular chaperone [Ramlibacter sp.]|uniref:fimbrial biogenesis chaperone n=1 Tax=Ramlibacter sp. TaxID=1917967 RepID=UPI00260EF37E|nr:molecular chaperone [Ramlibacter sp.]MDB5753328.1 molecular chaperone [Ramlibacter sp.]